MLIGAWNPMICPIWGFRYHGAQICAISAEVTGMQRWVHETKFTANGGCGYVQKPTWMIECGNFARFFGPFSTPLSNF